MWDVIKEVQAKNRHELTLTKVHVDKNPEELTDDTSGLCSLTELNLLRICNTSLKNLPENLGNLVNLTSLVCSVNKIQSLPSSVSSLKKLTLLDLSTNCLTSLPEVFDQLECLATLNISCNKLQKLPTLTNCKQLAHLDASYNELKEFVTFDSGFEKLADIKLSHNKISTIPAKISVLISLKCLEIESNSITEVPGNLADCPKLKDVKLNGNALKDRRFRKLVENSRTSPEQVIKYIKGNCPVLQHDKQNVFASETNEVNDKDEIQFELPTLKITHPCEELTVTVTKEVIALRPYMVCCIIHDMDLTGDAFRRFISLQNKLHDGVCKKRLHSTIATHDVTKLTTKSLSADGINREGLTYTSKLKDSIEFVPLNRRCKPINMTSFLRTLDAEADNQRKQQKSNAVTGLYKYLQLVKTWTDFPCLLDAAQNVLSVPPITNADFSKVESQSTTVLLEVTSDKSLAICKQTMTELIQGILDCNLGENISIQQVRVVADDGGLRCVFPASDDLLEIPSVEVIRPTKK